MIGTLINTLKVERKCRSTPGCSDAGSASDENDSVGSTAASSPLRFDSQDASDGADSSSVFVMAETKEFERSKNTVGDSDQGFITRMFAKKPSADMQCDRLQKIEELTVRIAELILHHQCFGDVEGLKQSIACHVSSLGSAQSQDKSDVHAAKVDKVSAKRDVFRHAFPSAEQEASGLKSKLASVEERAHMLQARLDELQMERSNDEKDKRSMRQQMEQLKIDNALATANLERMTEATQAAQRRAEELQKKTHQLEQQIANASKDHELAVFQLQAEKKDAVTQLQRHIERIKLKDEVRQGQLSQLQIVFKAELEKTQREKDDDLRILTDKLTKARNNLQESNAEKTELLQMIDSMVARRYR
eukprot:TRINITY_DN63248_c0_g1_i1.p1 TRINITY_DN63248_c0_g1~~TRINITY_DN63248_c0_g1_i1.p1  ORF type:complete len:377 (+),score=88.68 TRINITY_DN63248_c0_g1_i1:50-1132(+)